MLDMMWPKGPLLDPDKLVFTRGKYQFKSLEEVADENPSYLVYLITESGTDDETIKLVETIIEERQIEADRIQPSFNFER